MRKMAGKKRKHSVKRISAASGEAQVNFQFKLLSAIGIILIVAGHCYHGGISLAYEWFPAYSFHLSLFAFISGYFYKPKYESSPWKYIWKRTKRLVIPAYLCNVACGVLILILNEFGYSIGAEVNAYNLFVMPFVDGEAFQYNLTAWFAYSLFFVCVFNVLFRKLLGLLKIKNEFIILAIYLAIGMYGIQLAIDGNNHGFMKLLTRVMFFLPCFQLGRFYLTYLEENDTLNSIAYFSVLFGVQLLILTFFKEIDHFPSAMSGFKNGVIIPYVTAVTGIAFWLRISKLLAPVVRNRNFVRLIADNTYSIMLHQMMGYMSVKWLFYLLSCITPWFGDFNAENMKSNIWYYYLPNGLQLYGMLYLAGGIFFPIALKKLYDLFRKAAVVLKKRISKTQ